MEKLIEDVSYLATQVGPRPGGTEEERRAAVYLAEKIQKRSGLSFEIEDFEGAKVGTRAFTVCSLITVVLTILSVILSILCIPSLLIAVLSTIILTMELLDKPIISNLLRFGISQNVVAKYVPSHGSNQTKAQRKRKLVIVSHYDTGKTVGGSGDLMLKLKALSKLISVIGNIGCVVILVLRAFVITEVGGSGQLMLLIASFVVALIALFPLILAIFNSRAFYNEGANCNASANAALVELAGQIAEGSFGRFSTDDDNQPLIHGKQQAEAAGVIPDGATVDYGPTAQVNAQPQIDPLVAQENKLNDAKAALAAFAAPRSPRKKYDDDGNIVEPASNTSQGQTPATKAATNGQPNNLGQATQAFSTVGNGIQNLPQDQIPQGFVPGQYVPQQEVAPVERPRTSSSQHGGVYTRNPIGQNAQMPSANYEQGMQSAQVNQASNNQSANVEHPTPQVQGGVAPQTAAQPTPEKKQSVPDWFTAAKQKSHASKPEATQGATTAHRSSFTQAMDMIQQRQEQERRAAEAAEEEKRNNLRQQIIAAQEAANREREEAIGHQKPFFVNTEDTASFKPVQNASASRLDPNASYNPQQVQIPNQQQVQPINQQEVEVSNQQQLPVSSQVNASPKVSESFVQQPEQSVKMKDVKEQQPIIEPNVEVHAQSQPMAQTNVYDNQRPEQSGKMNDVKDQQPKIESNVEVQAQSQPVAQTNVYDDQRPEQSGKMNDFKEQQPKIEPNVEVQAQPMPQPSVHEHQQPIRPPEMNATKEQQQVLEVKTEESAQVQSVPETPKEVVPPLTQPEVQRPTETVFANPVLQQEQLDDAQQTQIQQDDQTIEDTDQAQPEIPLESVKTESVQYDDSDDIHFDSSVGLDQRFKIRQQNTSKNKKIMTEQAQSIPEQENEPQIESPFFKTTPSAELSGDLGRTDFDLGPEKNSFLDAALGDNVESVKDNHKNNDQEVHPTTLSPESSGPIVPGQIKQYAPLADESFVSEVSPEATGGFANPFQSSSFPPVGENVGMSEGATPGMFGTGSFAAVSDNAGVAGATGTFAPVTDQLLDNNAGDARKEDMVIDDADDDVFSQEGFTDSGAFAGRDYVDMPSKKRRGLFGLFDKAPKHGGHASKKGGDNIIAGTEEDWEGGSFSSLGAKLSMKKTDNNSSSARRGTNRNNTQENSEVFDNVDTQNRQERTSRSNKNDSRGNRGGKFSGLLSKVKKNPEVEDEFDDEQQFSEDDTRSNSSIISPRPGFQQQIRDFKLGDVNIEVWFVALGSELDENSGMKAFLLEHASELRGSIILEIEALGAGQLSLVESEGYIGRTSVADRVKRICRSTANKLGFTVPGVKLPWSQSSAAYAARAGYMSAKLVGMSGARPAYYLQEQDKVDNIEKDTLQDNINYLLSFIQNV